MNDIFKNAIYSIWENKLRSFLTLLGVVIGVTAVTTLVSLGQGLKNDVSKLIQGFGTNVMFIVPGKIDIESGQATQNPANLIASDILTLEDIKDISKLESIENVSPISLVTGSLKSNGNEASPTLFGTYPSFTQAMEVLSIEKGEMFKSVDSGNKIILGPTTAEKLFGEKDPVKQKITLNKEEFEVIGVFGRGKSSGVTNVFSSELDNMSAIPFDTATRLNKNQVKIMRVVAKAKNDEDIKKVKEEVKNVVLENHDGEENFSILTQDDMLDLFGQFLNMSTAMVSAIAAISIIVGGIGIMNIMFVTVSERTREIGLRKAVGATKGAILFQFLTEAIIVTLFGGLIGLGLSFFTGIMVSIYTPLTPAITPQVVALAIGISSVVGIIFGLWPAVKAARKDPIQALRYE